MLQRRLFPREWRYPRYWDHEAAKGREDFMGAVTRERLRAEKAKELVWELVDDYKRAKIVTDLGEYVQHPLLDPPTK